MPTTRPSQTTPQASRPKRGEIYLTALDPTLGREIQTTVRFPLNPVHVLLPAGQDTGLSVTSVALFNQIRAVDRMRLIKWLGTIDQQTSENVDEAIKISLGLIRL